MHNAPSVRYPVGRPRFAGLLAGGLWIAGSLVTLLWLQEAQAPGWRQAGAGMALAVIGAWALHSWVRSPCGELQWDGATWTAPCERGAGTLEVALDLQHLLLVHWQSPLSARWFWLERRSLAQRWPDLRRAVYSPARPQALPQARPPAATP